MSLIDSGISGSDALSIMNSRTTGNGFWGDGSFWIIILFLFALMGGNGFGGYGDQSDVQRGFDQQAMMGGISGLTNGQANILQVLNANQNANTVAMNQLAMSLQNCCCENRQQIADVKYAIATEAAATRAAGQANTQAILDKLCQQEIDALKEQNNNLRTQLNLASLRESQTAQTASILADNAKQTVTLEQYLNPTPVPSYTVPNPNCCSNNFACGMA